MDMHRRSGLVSSVATGALIGALLTAALMALLYLADQSVGLPLVMYDLFDWLARVTPGKVITRVIDFMVEAIQRSGAGDTSSTAKTIENILAMITFFFGGVTTGAVLFAVLRHFDVRLRDYARLFPGLIAGMITAVPMILISRDVNVTATASESMSMFWLAVAFLGWGALLSWTYYRLEAAAPPAAAGTGQAVPLATAEQISRREFLIRVGAASATLTIVGAGIGRYLQYLDDKEYKDLVKRRRAAAENIPDNLPNANDPLQPVPGTRPEYTPLEDHYRIDINSRPPEIDGETWRLQITGLVDNPLTLTLEDLKTRYDPVHQYVTLACISNPIGGDLTSTTRWTGASLQKVLADARPQESATHLNITSEDGFYETVALDLVESEARIMLAYNWDGIPLLYKHGFPLRIYIPDRYGMKQPKWITNIDVTDHDEDGYWVVRSWDKTAQMRATSVVDVVAGDMTYEQDGQVYVPVGGIAHAGARGISKVEVKVDDDDWVEAQLRLPLSETTWVIWRFDWPFESGGHTFAVRCYEGDGTAQIAESNPTKPSGATGIDKLTRSL
jgi:DMSO/TMAO reductase YedYZ molybdopterin-dependent catalytic subunit